MYDPKEYNKKWYREHGKEWYKEYNSTRKDKNKNATFIRKYGITLDDYNRMFEEQEGKCVICGTHQAVLDKPLHVDHCHETNKVRGLLCHNCNWMIGLSFDNPDTLKKAANYLGG